MRLIDGDALRERLDTEVPCFPLYQTYNKEDVIRAVLDAPTVAMSENGITLAWTPDADILIKEVAERALDEYEYKGRTIREWVETIMALPEPPEEVSGDE